MAVDKLVDSTQLDNDLTSVANAIRTKGGTSAQLAFPSGFVTAIQNIPSGGVTPTGTINIDDDGTYDVTDYATAEVAIDYPSKVREVTIVVNRNSQDTSGAKAFTIYSSMTFNDGIKQSTKVLAIAAGATTNTTTIYVPKQRPIIVIGTGAAIGNFSVTIDSAYGECIDTPHILGSSSTNITKAIYLKSSAPDQLTITVNLNSQAAYPETVVLDTLSVTQNGTYTPAAGTAYSSVVANVSGSGSSGAKIGSTDTQIGMTDTTSITFTGLPAEPIAFYMAYDDGDLYTGSPAKVAAVVFDGTSVHGQTITNTSDAQVSYDSTFTKSYSNGSLTITTTGAVFPADNYYYLEYIYNGTSSDIETVDVQVGSGATSITFTGLDKKPAWWSCIFKSNFGTSSGYQRVITVFGNGMFTRGMAMDSHAHNQESWTSSYSDGSLTITSVGTNDGGYFHQPGYYQLTAVYSPYQDKYVVPTNYLQTITPDSDFEALDRVIVDGIPSEWIIPTGNYAITQNGVDIDIAQYATVSVNVSGASKNVQIVQGTARTGSSSATAIGSSLTVSKTGIYDIYWTGFRTNTSTSYTWATQLYIGGTAYGTENTSWTNNQQNNHLSNVSLSANQTLRVYGRETRGTSYYVCAPMLAIVEA